MPHGVTLVLPNASLTLTLLANLISAEPNPNHNLVFTPEIRLHDRNRHQFFTAFWSASLVSDLATQLAADAGGWTGQGGRENFGVVRAEDGLVVRDNPQE